MEEKVSHSPGPSLEFTCEDGHAVEAAVQLAEQDGQEAVCCQHAGISCALVIHHHILWFCGIHLGTIRAEVRLLGRTRGQERQRSAVILPPTSSARCTDMCTLGGAEKPMAPLTGFAQVRD